MKRDRRLDIDRRGLFRRTFRCVAYLAAKERHFRGIAILVPNLLKCWPLAIGTQTGGSVIRPASYCGVTGYKPTFGAIPRRGVLMQSPTLDTMGVFAADPEGAAMLAELLFGHDHEDPATTLTPAPRLLETTRTAPPASAGGAATAASASVGTATTAGASVKTGLIGSVYTGPIGSPVSCCCGPNAAAGVLPLESFRSWSSCEL